MRISWAGAGIEIIKTLPLVCLYKNIPSIQAAILQGQIQHQQPRKQNILLVYLLS